MKLFLLILNIVLLTYWSFLAFIAAGVAGLGGGRSIDPVFIYIIIMVLCGLVGAGGMLATYKMKTRTAYYIFAVIGIAIPTIMFKVLSK
jgi:hypothetical protein